MFILSRIKFSAVYQSDDILDWYVNKLRIPHL